MALGAVFRPDVEPDVRPRLRSRAEALAEFKGILARHHPKFRVVEISGDRWSGKTTVLQDFADLATRTGWQVAAGSATSSAAGIAFGAFGESLNELIGSVSAELVPILSPVHLRRLAEIIPALETSPQQALPGGSADRYKVLNAISKLIEALCTLGELVLLLDDMHWADEAALDLLTHLLRYPPDGEVIVVLAHRPRQCSHNLHGLISTAAAGGVCDRIALAPLKRSDALALLPDDFSSSQCTAVLNESGGNPGLLRALASMRIVPGQSLSAPPSLPPGILAACLSDFRALSARGRLVAQSAAVLDEPFDPDMLRIITQFDDRQVRAAIDELVSQDLICPDKSFPRLRFVNPLLRAAAYQSAGVGWLAGARAKAAELLASRGRPAGQVARHVAYASAIGDEGSARFLLHAARENLWLDPAQAALWVTTAADLQTGLTASGPGSQLLLGKALALAGRLRQALDVLGELAAHNGGDLAGWAETVSWLAWVRFLTGRPDQSRDELTAALNALPDSEQAAKAELRRRRVILALESRTQPAGDDEAGLGRHLASTSGMPAAELSALLAAAACRRHSAPARRYVAAAAENFDKVGDEYVVRHLEGLYWLARAQSALGDHEMALARCERGMRLAEQRQIGSMLPRFAAALAAFQLSAGDLNSAARNAACAQTAAALTGSDHLVAIASAVQTKIRRAKRFAAVTPEGPPIAALHGRSAASREPAARSAAESPNGGCELDDLSKRELQVALLVSDGRTNEQIARRLGLSSKTVETYLARIFKKLAVSCRAEVATMVGRSIR